MSEVLVCSPDDHAMSLQELLGAGQCLICHKCGMSWWLKTETPPAGDTQYTWMPMKILYDPETV